jgi:hypothetical protein
MLETSLHGYNHIHCTPLGWELGRFWNHIAAVLKVLGISGRIMVDDIELQFYVYNSITMHDP